MLHRVWLDFESQILHGCSNFSAVEQKFARNCEVFVFRSCCFFGNDSKGVSS